MAFRITGREIDSYHRNGFAIFRDLIPPTLLRELRVMADEGRTIARERSGPQAQRLQPIQQFLDIAPYRKLCELPELVDAVDKLFGEGFHIGFSPPSFENSHAGILYEPAEQPWCTQWHRDWRDNIPGLDIDLWRQHRDDIRMFNQVNCALYEDHCTWVVPGSHLRDDLPDEIRRFPMRPVPGPTITDDMTSEQREVICLEYVQSMPGALCARLNAGDYMLYRNSLWHLGNYLPYKKRATLHDGVWTEAFHKWFTNWPRRPDGKSEMANANTQTPEYQAWAAKQETAGAV